MEVFLAYLFLITILVLSFRYSKYFYFILLCILPGWGFLLSVLWNNFDLPAETIRLLRGTKDFIIIGLFLSCLPNLKRKRIIEALSGSFGIVVGIFFLLILVAYFWGTQQAAADISSSSFDKTTSLRSYLLPFVLLFFGMANGNNQPFLHQVIKILLYIGILSGICAIFEIFILPRDFLAQIGYTNYLTEFSNLQDYQTTVYGLPFTYFTDNGLLRRAGSFFSSGPLDMSNAMLVIVPLAMFSYINKLFNARFCLVALVLSVSSLLLSISRLAILVLLAQMILLFILTQKGETSFLHRNKKIIVTGLFLLAGIGITFFISEGIRMLSFKGNLTEYIIASLNLSDPSSISHLYAFVLAFNIISSHPLGIGLGNNVVESFFLNVWIEAGVFALLSAGTIIYLIVKKSYWIYRNSTNILNRVIAITTLFSWVSLSIEISKSVVGWATILAFCSAFFFAGIIMANKLKEE